jgi:hypothetical protein
MAEIETERRDVGRKAIDIPVKKDKMRISITTEKPEIRSWEDYDVFSGRPGTTREEYKASTFHNSIQEPGDNSFEKKTAYMQVTGRDLFEEEKKLETDVEEEMESEIEPEGQKE